MDLLHSFLDFFLHLDEHLQALINEYGTTTYIILFLIIFVETGVVIMPFLPGDSLLFAAGTFAAMGSLNLSVLVIILFIAAVLGDSLNYFIGKTIGLKILRWKIRNRQLVQQKNIDKTHEFYEKYGAKTIIIARFVPIVRTLAPFVAGIGTMDYRKFIMFNVFGGAIWIAGLLFLGYFFGTIPIVKENFEIVIFLIIFISVLPIFVELIRHKMKKRRLQKENPQA